MFKVGDKVTSPKFNGIGVVVAILWDAGYPIRVENVDGCTYTFTLDGRYSEAPVSLFHIKEEPTMEKVTVTVQVSKSFEITQAEQQLILDLVNDKFKAIKFIRAQYDLPLIEAKRICEAVWSTS